MKIENRAIWWERWAGGYKPVHWKAWVWLAGFCGAIWPVMEISEWLARIAGMTNEHTAWVIGASLLNLWGYWFVEQHTAPKK